MNVTFSFLLMSLRIKIFFKKKRTLKAWSEGQDCGPCPYILAKLVQSRLWGDMYQVSQQHTQQWNFLNTMPLCGLNEVSLYLSSRIATLSKTFRCHYRYYIH